MTTLDTIFHEIEVVLSTLLPPKKRVSSRPMPGEEKVESNLKSHEKSQVASLVRVNHAGEVCAKGLYQGQAWTASLPSIRKKMQEASLEETDHLAWCEQRLEELEGKTSLLNPCWYFASFLLGAFAGAFGDNWSLGFVAETENQVTQHLAHHLALLPAKDEKTKQLLTQMQVDEMAHAEAAMQAGGVSLPLPLQYCMRWASKCMTKTSYYL
jgi:ubiquinone biosynthesis monooxygenase Coq7